MEQATPSAGRYQGCIGTREDSVADRVVVRPANWGPRAVWHRILDRASRFWRVGLAALVSVLVIWAGRGLLSDEVEEAVVEVEEVNTQPAEQILQGDVLDTVMDQVEISPVDQMNAALFRSTEAASAQARYHYLHSSDPETREKALMIIAEVARRGWPDDYRGTFLATLLPDVLESSRNYKVPPSICLGQAILESGWGRSGLSSQHYNLFGIKAGSSKQRVEVPTREHSGTAMFMTRATFRTYSSARESITDHARLLGEHRAYAHARASWADWREYLDLIAPRYASAPTYAARVKDLVKKYHLDDWDEMIVEAASLD